MKLLALVTILFTFSINAHANLGEQVLKYAVEDNYQELEVLLNDNVHRANEVNVNFQNQNGDTPLILAAKNKNTKSVQVLLYFSAFYDIKIDQRNRVGKTAMYYANETGCVKCVEVLLAHEARIRNLGPSGVNALFVLSRSPIATDTEKLKIAEFLLAKDLNVNFKDKSGRSSLHMLSKLGNQRTIDLLLNFGARINTKTNKKGLTPLHFAARNGHKEVVRTLINDGAYLNLTDFKGNTALIKASSEGHLDVVKILTKAGAELSTMNNQQTDALLASAFQNRGEVYKYLLSQGVTGPNKLKAEKIIKAYQSFTKYRKNFVRLTNEALNNQPAYLNTKFSPNKKKTNYFNLVFHVRNERQNCRKETVVRLQDLYTSLDRDFHDVSGYYRARFRTSKKQPFVGLYFKTDAQIEKWIDSLNNIRGVLKRNDHFNFSKIALPKIKDDCRR